MVRSSMLLQQPFHAGEPHTAAPAGPARAPSMRMTGKEKASTSSHSLALSGTMEKMSAGWRVRGCSRQWKSRMSRHRGQAGQLLSRPAAKPCRAAGRSGCQHAGPAGAPRTREEGDVEDEGVQAQADAHGHQQPGVAPHRHLQQRVVLRQRVHGVAGRRGVGVGWGGTGWQGAGGRWDHARQRRLLASACSSRSVPPQASPPANHQPALTASR